MTNRACWWWLAITFVILSGVRTAAAERTRIAVIAVEPDSRGAMAAALATALEKTGFAVVYPSVAAKAVFELRLAELDLTDHDAAQLARRLMVDVVVTATLATTRGRRTLEILAYVASTHAARFTIAVDDLRTRQGRRRLRTGMEERVRALREEPGVPIDLPTDSRPPEPPGRIEIPRSDLSTTLRLPPAPTPTAAVTSRARRRPEQIELALGVSVSARELVFASREFPQAPRPFQGAPLPGTRIEGAAYPLGGALGGIPVAVGIGGELDRTSNHQLESSAEPARPVDGRAGWWSLGIRLRLGSTRNSVVLGVGYGRRSRSARRDALLDPSSLDLPDVSYTTIDPGLAARLTIVGRLAAVVAIRALVIADAGAIQEPSSYGRAEVFGVWGRAGFELAIRPRLSFVLAAEISHVGFTFTGDGVMANGRDGDPSTRDVGGASDRTIGGLLVVGYRH